MNFIMANVDFDRYFSGQKIESGHAQIPLRLLTEGLPGAWHRPQLFEAYAEGIRERLFYPALHGLTHFCERAIARELNAGGERSELLKTLWQARTPYIPVSYTHLNSRKFRRSLFVVEDIKKGELFTRQNVRSIRPADGLHPRHFNEVLGKRAACDIERGTPMSWELVES